MGEPEDKGKYRALRAKICKSFVGSLRSLSLYPPEHPETGKKLQEFLSQVNGHLTDQKDLTMLFVDGEAVVENTRLPELSAPLGRLLQRFEEIRLQRLTFKTGLTYEELVRFLQFLLPLVKNPSGGDLPLAMSEGSFPHIFVSRLQLDALSQDSLDNLSITPQGADRTMISLRDRIREVYADFAGTLPEIKLTLAREVAASIHGMLMSEELPLKVVLYRRNPDPDLCLHAMHVCALSTALAQQLKVHTPLLQELGLGALLHDTGLFVFSPAAGSETAAATLDEKQKQWDHPALGAKMLLSAQGVPDVVPMIAYEHHLHYGGGGYPQQKQRRQLNLASLIVGIADSYDNLRRKRPDQPALPLTEALNWMDGRQGKEFHPLLLKRFRAMVKAQAHDKR